MALTDKLTEVTTEMLRILETERGALGIRQVYDGDMNIIPETPSVAVIPGTKSRELYAAPVTTRVDLQVALMVYHNRLQEVQKQQRETVELSEAIEELFHRHVNQTLSGLVIFGMFTSVEPGYADRQGTILRTTRMTWEAQSRHSLPTS
jgi:hypothetical protein